MKWKPAIPLSDLSGDQSLKAVIRHDLKAPNRVYCEFPPRASLSHDEAIAIANRLIDVMESTT